MSLFIPSESVPGRVGMGESNSITPPPLQWSLCPSHPLTVNKWRFWDRKIVQSLPLSLSPFHASLLHAIYGFYYFFLVKRNDDPADVDGNVQRCETECAQGLLRLLPWHLDVDLHDLRLLLHHGVHRSHRSHKVRPEETRWKGESERFKKTEQILSSSNIFFVTPPIPSISPSDYGETLNEGKDLLKLSYLLPEFPERQWANLNMMICLLFFSILRVGYQLWVRTVKGNNYVYSSQSASHYFLNINIFLRLRTLNIMNINNNYRRFDSIF